MAATKKKICLLLAGGTWTTDKSKNLLTVNVEEDIDLWLATMPELNILSAIDTHFFADEEVMMNPNIWSDLAQWIVKNAEKYDGFVVVTKVEQVIASAIAINFLLQNFQKTIVFTASQMSGVYTNEKKEMMQSLLSEHGGLGLRSNLINAVQAAAESLPNVALMFGSRLVSAVKAKLEWQQGRYILTSLDDDYLAKVDFGISFKNGLSQIKSKEKIFTYLSAELCVLDQQVGVNYLWPAEAFKNYRAILVLMSDESLSKEEKKYFHSLNKPVILHHQKYLHQEKNFITLNSCSKEVAIIKTMWLIKNISTSDWSKNIKANLIDEFLNI